MVRTATQFKSELMRRGLLQHIADMCQDSAITLDELFRSQSPPAPACRARVFRWLQQEKGYKPTRIGRLFGRGHSSVLYALGTLPDDDVAASPVGGGEA